MQTASKRLEVRHVYTCAGCFEPYGKARRRGRTDRCPRCLRRDAMKRFKVARPTRLAELARERTARLGPRERARKAEWQRRNRGLVTAKTRRRQLAQRHRTPAWADHEAIKAFYVEAQRITDETGVPHEVDHVLPLQGKSVSGLHVEANLRVIPKVENARKGNRHS